MVLVHECQVPPPPWTRPLQENSALHLEEEYRKRQLQVTTEVRRRLEYQVALEQAQRQLQQDHLVEWLESRVTRDMRDRAVSGGNSVCCWLLYCLYKSSM